MALFNYIRKHADGDVVENRTPINDYTKDINGIVNVNSNQFKGLFGRWRLRKLLNDNPQANIFTGDLDNGLYTSGQYDPDGFSRREIRALRREAKQNWKKYTPQIRQNAGQTIDDGQAITVNDYAKKNALQQLGEYFINKNNPTARWIVPENAYRSKIDTENNISEQDNTNINGNVKIQDDEGLYKILYPEYQQGGPLGQQQSDKDEQLMQAALFGYIGQNPDAIQSQEGFTKAIYAVINAYSKAANGDEEEIKTYLNQEYTKAGEDLVQRTNQELYKSIKKPGALKQIITGIIQQQKQQGIKQAKMGTKLDYIKQLKNICPEGYEIEFRKAGGRVCPVCKKKHKAQKAQEGNKIEKECKGGISKAMNGIKAQMKCGGKVKKHEEGDTIDKNDTIHFVRKDKYGKIKREVRDLSGGKYKQYKPLTQEEYKKLPKKDKVRVDEKDMNKGRV